MKLALWAFVGALGVLLILSYTGIARFETPPRETATLPLPEGITQKKTFAARTASGATAGRKS